MDFARIRWQSEIKDSLKKGLNNKTLKHAFLFIGDKETTNDLAHALANAFLCDKKADNMCKTCPSCKKLLAGSHPDKILVEKLKAKQSYGVEEVREMVSSMYVKPFLGDEKIYIFDDASALTPAAQNALLKVIEEPPAYGRIILCADKEEDLLPTVLSRIPHKYKLKSPSAEEIEDYLINKYPEKKQIAGFCAIYSQGNPALAESLLQKDGAFDLRKRLCLFLKQMMGNDKSVIFNFCGYLKDNQEDFSQNADFLFAIFRDIMFLNLGISPQINSDLSDEIKALSENWSNNALQKAVLSLTELCTSIKNSANFEGAVLSFLLGIWEDLHD